MRSSRGLALVLLLAVLAGGGWFALHSLANPERLRAELIRSVERATGRQLTLSGPIRLSLGLSPSFAADDMALANIEGGSRPQMVTAKTLRAQVALLPLLAGDVVVEEVTLVGADILLERAADGTPNWQFKPVHRALYEGEPAAQGGGHGSPIEIRRLRLEGGALTWRPAAGPMVSLAVDRLDAEADSDSAPTRITLDAHAGDTPLQVKIAAGSYARLRGGPVTVLAGAWPLTIEATGAGAAVKLDGGINHPEEMRGYAFLLTGTAPDLAPLAAIFPPFGKLPLKEVNVTARLSDGSTGQFGTRGLSVHAGASDLGAVVPGLVIKEAVFSAPGPGQQAELNVDGVFAGAPLRLAGTATQPDTLERNVPVPVVFTAQAATATLSARGTVPPALDQNGFDLTLTARVPNLADLSPLAGRTLPTIHDMVLDTRLGDAGTRLRGLDLRDMTLASSLGDLAGRLTVSWAPIRTVSGTLKARRFDLDAAQAAFAGVDLQPAATPPPNLVAAPPAPAIPAPEAAPGAAEPLIPDTPLPFATLRGANADLTLTLGEITAGGEAYHDLQAHLLLADGRLALNPLRVTTPQGAVIAGLSIDAGVDIPPVALSFRSPSLSAAALSTALGHEGAATGRVQVDAQLSGAGNTPRALAASLGGHLGLSMVDGQLTESAFEGVLGDALAAAGVPPITGTSQVRCLAWRSDFTQGRGRLRVFALDTSRLSMDGDGAFDLADETLSLHLRPVIRLASTGVAAPVSLTGPFAAPKAALDPVLGGGRVGITIGGGLSQSTCAAALATARGGMPGPMPAIAQDTARQIKKPKDLLEGLFH